MAKDCLNAAAGLSDADSFWYVERTDELMAAGVDQKAAQRRAATELQQRITGERDSIGRFAGIFTPPSQWSEEAFAGAMAFNARDGFAPPTVRQQMNAVLAQRNRGLQRVNPASVLEADIDRAARALALVVGEIQAGRYEQTEVPIGPMPHVLHMLGAPMQMVQMNTSIARKILVDKHGKDFADITPRQLVEGIYKPAMVTQARAANEFEVTTDLVAKGGDPITAVIKVNTVQPVAAGKPLKVGSVTSAYARSTMGPGDTLLQRVLTGKLRYVELERAQQAVGKGWARFQPSLTTALANRTVKGELDLVKFIGDNYRPDSSPEGWADAPAFSRREDGLTDGPQPLYVSRPVANAEDILAWARSQGIQNLEPADKLHVTVVYSKAPVDPAGGGVAPAELMVAGGKRQVKRLGDEGAVVLSLESRPLQARWQQWRDAGASWDFESYQPHVTLSYDPGSVDLASIEPYRGAVVLGAERAEALDTGESDGAFDLMADPGGQPQTETAAFKRWFGSSKAVDDNGKPLVMYHGTGGDFSAFKAGKADGVFVSSDPVFADRYAMRGMGTDPSMYDSSMEVDGLSPNVMPLYARAERPFDFRNEAEVKRLAAAVAKIDPGGANEFGISTGEWGVLETDAVQQAARQLGYDSMWVAEDGAINLQVFSPLQLKSATGNVGFFDPANDDIRYSLRSNRPGRFNLRRFNIGHQVIEAIQNRYNRWKQAIEDIRGQGGSISEANDFYRAEERYWGKVGARMDDFKAQIQSFIDEVAADKLTLDDVALYAYAQHAPERNAWIASQRATMPDGGSGMMTQDALDIIDEARVSGLQPALDRHAATMRAWIQGTRDILFNDGLIDQNEYDAWTNMFQDYVPLRGLEGMPEQRGTGQGFNIRGREGKAAMGRKSQARQIIEQIVLDRSRALIRSGKNEVLRSFAQFVLDNPSPNLWEINAVETKPFTSVDTSGNRIIDEQQVVISDDRTVTVKDGGREIHILVNDDKLLEQLRNLNADNPSVIVGALLFVNRVLARLYTSMNPVFTVLNGARDFQAATVGMIDDIGFMAVPRLWANMPMAMVEAYRAEAGSFSPDYEDYRRSGGKTGFFDFKTIDAQTAELQALLADADRMLIDPRKLGPKAMALIESFNAGIENATRLAAFKTARQMGRTMAEAAHISKNITVNFNRRGTMTPTLSAYFLFFNPAIQGTARIAQAMTSPKVVGTMGLAMLGIAALAMRNAGMGEDDDGVAWWDKIPDEVKERNIVIVLPPGASGGEQVRGSKVGRYVKIPMPYGYNFFAVVANQMVDIWRNSQDPRRGRGVTSGMAKAFTAFMGAWVPVSELGRSFETPEAAVLAAVPDALNPLAQVAINTSTFGREMRPEDRASQYNPDSSKYFAGQAGTIFQRAAEGMNELTGGDRYRSGLIDVAPSTLEALARGYGGGPVGFTVDWINAFYARQTIERATPRYEALPFVKQLYGVIDAETDRMVGYQRLEEASKIVEPMRRAARERGEGARESIEDMREEFGPMLNLGSAIDTTRQRLSEVRKRELAIISGPEAEAIKFVKLQEQALRRRQILQSFNAAYDRAIVAADAAKKQPAGR